MTIESFPSNIRGVVEQVLDCLAAKSLEQGVEMVCDVAGPLLSDGVVWCDWGRFRQVLLNLVGNNKVDFMYTRPPFVFHIMVLKKTLLSLASARKCAEVHSHWVCCGLRPASEPFPS